VKVGDLVRVKEEWKQACEEFNLTIAMPGVMNLWKKYLDNLLTT
jgi:hypothetical protein